MYRSKIIVIRFIHVYMSSPVAISTRASKKFIPATVRRIFLFRGVIFLRIDMIRSIAVVMFSTIWREQSQLGIGIENIASSMRVWRR